MEREEREPERHEVERAHLTEAHVEPSEDEQQTRNSSDHAGSLEDELEDEDDDEDDEDELHDAHQVTASAVGSEGIASG